jgi:hypothetical protein
VEYVREVVEADGPFDGLMGFSQVSGPPHFLPTRSRTVCILTLDDRQGASVAAAFLAQSPTAIKFAVFICAALIPPVAATTEELVRTIGTFGHIDLPTLHCVGQHDTCYPQSVQLSKSCESSLGQVLVLPGGHDVPRDDVTSRNIAHAIEKCARKALARC